MTVILSGLGAVVLFLIKAVGVLLLIVLLLALFLLLCPFCADISWEDEVLCVRAGAFGMTFPVWQYPAPEPEEPKGFWGRCKQKIRAWRAQRRQKKAAQKPEQPKQPVQPRKKAKLTLEIICTLLQGAGKLIQAVFGALRVTKIRICLGVRGDDPAEAARSYGKLQAWMYPLLGVLDHFVYLQFDELRILPDFGAESPAVKDRLSCRITAQALFVVIAAVRVLYEFWRKKVLDIFL